MKPLVIDTETTTFQHGHPFSESNKLCYIGAFDGIHATDFRIEFDALPYGPQLASFSDYCSDFDLFVGFNFKFDLHWLNRYGVKFPTPFKIWDCQAVEFIITGQETPFPSLEDTCKRVGLPGKFGNIAEKYWNQEIDTPQIPEEELREYLKNDCEITWKLFQWQVQYLADKPKLKRLCWDVCQDIEFTGQMERNGLPFDRDLSIQIGNEYQKRIDKIDQELYHIAPEVGNHWNSNDWLSAWLYGGRVFVDDVEKYIFTYKNGEQKEKLRNIKRPIDFPRLAEPLKNSKVKKEGFFRVNEGVLKRLKLSGKAKKVVELILTRNKIEKKVSTYFHGWPKIQEEMQWEKDRIHGQLNHANAKTGRLSSSRPNMQNSDPELLKCIKSRFPLKPIKSS